ncbi:MAG: hypothetical protein H0V17_21430 [Deltaproteobacteria bacterium]|nr:hypothetical protein [Deltaproteobacteria bacterium]
MRISIGHSIFVVLALAAPLGLALAESPSPPKSVKGHPNLLSAQKLVAQAFDKLEAAQKANEYDLGGHAAKAKELLRQAKAEIGLAAEAADKTNPNRKKSDQNR